MPLHIMPGKTWWKKTEKSRLTLDILGSMMLSLNIMGNFVADEPKDQPKPAADRDDG
jgi:hypothetical protein